LQIHPLFDKAESKNKLLRSVAGGGVEQIGQLQARWDKFELMMQSHELMVKEQVGILQHAYLDFKKKNCITQKSSSELLHFRILLMYSKVRTA